MTEVISLPLAEYRIPIYKRWDEKKLPCPHNPRGWMVYHWELKEKEEKENGNLITHSDDSM